ncbi:MAG: response regulator [Zoogloeaceae bacterium]|jgi:putative two-component system response regulator|nr:response regulator [Zoogloeaceae bacterium]
MKETNRRAKVMLVDDDLSILVVGRDMLKSRFEVYPLPSAERLFAALEHMLPDMLLLDTSKCRK